jgi:hypothetical protein
MPGSILQAVIVYNKSNVFGLQKDAEILAESLPAAGRRAGQMIGKVKLMDCREPPVACDICIHLEVPYAVWFPWARINVMMVNSEWWLEDKWAGYWDKFDVAVFRDEASKAACLAAAAKSGGPREAIVVPWCLSVKQKLAAKAGSNKHEDGFVWFIGGSTNKRAAAEAVLPLWRSTYPNLTVCAVEPLTLDTGSLPPNVVTKYGYLSDKEFQRLSEAHPAHICISRAESFGYTAAEAQVAAAFTVLNTLPVYEVTYKDQPAAATIGWIGAAISDKEALQTDLDTVVKQFLGTSDLAAGRTPRAGFASSMTDFHLNGMEALVKECLAAAEVREKLPRHMPPLLNIEDCPPISVVTLVHNRPKFIENACLNLLSTDYPRDKIEWVVVDDSDPDQSASNRIVQFGEKFAPGKVTYIPLNRKRSIGFKRNLGVEKSAHDIIVMMDDDDHYPSTSFRRRVAYLLKARQPYECAACTTIAMYDLLKGTSAVNVPPYTLSLAERCSEATLTFTKRFWSQQKFADVGMAEGEGFLRGREGQVVEIPPQQIIVALSHRNNTGGRAMPDAGNGCFWGFPRPLLEFLHGLVGIKVEAA